MNLGRTVGREVASWSPFSCRSRFPEPQAAFGEFHGISRGIADIYRPASVRPSKIRLDRDRMGRKHLFPPIQITGGRGKTDMAVSRRAVRWHGQIRVPGRSAGLGRIEDQEHRVSKSKKDMPVADTRNLAEAEHLPVETFRSVEIIGIDRGFENVGSVGFLGHGVIPSASGQHVAEFGNGQPLFAGTATLA